MSWELILDELEGTPECLDAAILDRVAHVESDVLHIRELIRRDAPLAQTNERIERARGALASLKILLGQREMGRLFQEVPAVRPSLRRPGLVRRRRTSISRA